MILKYTNKWNSIQIKFSLRIKIKRKINRKRKRKICIYKNKSSLLMKATYYLNKYIWNKMLNNRIRV